MDCHAVAQVAQADYLFEAIYVKRIVFIFVSHIFSHTYSQLGLPVVAVVANASSRAEWL